MRRIAVGSTNLRCLFEGCGTSITEANLRVILTDEQYKKYTDSPLEKLIKAQPENYKRCPQCHILIERVKPTQIDLTQRVIGPNGVALNKEALKHREECRMRYVMIIGKWAHRSDAKLVTLIFVGNALSIPITSDIPVKN